MVVCLRLAGVVQVQRTGHRKPRAGGLIRERVEVRDQLLPKLQERVADRLCGPAILGGQPGALADVRVQPHDGLERSQLQPAEVQVVGEIACPRDRCSEEAADVVTDVRLADAAHRLRQGCLRREGVPCPPRVAREVKRRAVLRPCARRVCARALVLQGGTEPRECHAALSGVDHRLGLQVIDPAVRGDTGGAHLAPIAAPVLPPERNAGVLDRLLEGEVRLCLGNIAPVERGARGPDEA